MSNTEVVTPATPAKPKRGTRKFVMAMVDALPDNPPTQRNTDPVYTTKLRELLESGLEAGHNGYVELAVFSTAAGARTVVKNFEKGEYIVPKGTEWEFDTRRFMAEGEKKGSILYAKLVTDSGAWDDSTPTKDVPRPMSEDDIVEDEDLDAADEDADD